MSEEEMVGFIRAVFKLLHSSLSITFLKVTVLSVSSPSYCCWVELSFDAAHPRATGSQGYIGAAETGTLSFSSHQRRARSRYIGGKFERTKSFRNRHSHGRGAGGPTWAGLASVLK